MLVRVQETGTVIETLSTVSAETELKLKVRYERMVMVRRVRGRVGNTLEKMVDVMLDLALVWVKKLALACLVKGLAVLDVCLIILGR